MKAALVTSICCFWALSACAIGPTWATVKPSSRGSDLAMNEARLGQMPEVEYALAGWDYFCGENYDQLVLTFLPPLPTTNQPVILSLAIEGNGQRLGAATEPTLSVASFAVGQLMYPDTDARSNLSYKLVEAEDDQALELTFVGDPLRVVISRPTVQFAGGGTMQPDNTASYTFEARVSLSVTKIQSAPCPSPTEAAAAAE